MRPKRPEKKERKDWHCLSRGESNYITLDRGFNDCWDAHTPLINYQDQQISELVEVGNKLLGEMEEFFDGKGNSEIKAETYLEFRELILKHKGNK